MVLDNLINYKTKNSYFFKSFGYRVFNADPNILIWQIEKEDMMLVNIYVNNFLLAASNQDLLDWVKKTLKTI